MNPINEKTLEHCETLSSAAKKKAVSQYLNIRYAEDRRPFTAYPLKLCSYLTNQYIQPYHYKNLLDLGCGRGDFLHAFAQCGLEVQGLDNTSTDKNIFPETIISSEIEATTLPFKENTFDVVFSKSVIEHIHNTDVFLSEIYRILKPSGMCILMTPDWKAQFKHFYDDYTHVKPFTQMGLSDVIQAHGFTQVEVKRFRQLPFVWKNPNLHWLCDLLSFFPEYFKKYTIVKFSKEWMLLSIAQKPQK